MTWSPTEDGNDNAIVGYPTLILFTVASGTMVTMTGMFVLSPLLPVLIDRLAISPSQAGLALTIMWACYAISQYPGGTFSDQLSNKTILITSLFTLILGFVLLILSGDYIRFLGAVVVIGIGAGLYVPTSLSQLSDLFVSKRGQAFGLNTASLNLGGALSAGLAIIALSISAWQIALIPIVVLLFIVAICMHLWNRESYVIDSVSFSFMQTICHVRRRPDLVRLTIIASMFSFIYQGTVSFLPTLLQVEKGFSSSMSGSMFAGFFLFGMLVNPLAGRIGDQVGYIRTATGVTLTATLGVVIMILAPSLIAASIGIAILAAGLLPFWTVMNTHIITHSPDSSQGGVFGMVRSIYLTIGSFGPIVIGSIAEVANYLVAFKTYVFCLLVVATLLYALPQQETDSRSGSD